MTTIWSYVPEAIAMVVLGIIFWQHQRTLYVKTRREELFVNCIATAFFATIINVISIISIGYPSVFPQWLDYVISDAFFVSAPLIVVTFALYWLYLLYEDLPGKRFYAFALWYCRGYGVAMLALTVINHFIPLVYYYDESQQYARGQWNTLPIIMALTCLTIAAIALIKEWRYLQRYVRSGFIAAPMLMAPIMCVQIIFPTLQLQGTALMIGMLVIFLSFHSSSRAYDKQTQCLNAESFQIACARSYPNNPPHAFAMASIENMDILNNEYGREAVSGLLVQVSQYIQSAYGQAHTYRTSGNQFVFALTGHKNMRDVLETHSHLNKEWRFNGISCRLDCLVAGIDIADERDLAKDILAYLNCTIRKTREQGRGMVKLCDEKIIAEFDSEKRLANRLRDAIDAGAFNMNYEPICRVKDGVLQTVAADCGVGISIEDELYTYAQIVALAQRYNLLHKIDGIILTNACQFQKRLKEQGYGEIKLFCEITQYQMQSPGIAERIMQEVRRSQADSSKIQIMVAGKGGLFGVRMRESIEALQKQGIGVCMKDTAESNLNDLLATPFAFVKLDESTLFDMGLSQRLNAFFKLTLSFFNQFSTDVIAKNVMSTEHIPYLEAHGVQYVQGACIGVPIAEQAFLSRLQAESVNPQKVRLVSGIRI